MRRRSGFTLVEVLVAMALILFIMSILAAAFGAATAAVSDLKAAGDLAEKLRGASSVLRRDLAADHFTADATSGPRLSDYTSNALNFWNRLDPTNTPYGFFRIYQGSPATAEGTDLDGIPSYFQTTTSLHYTIALHGSNRGDFLSASVPAGSPLVNNADPLLGPTDTRYEDTRDGANNIVVYNSQFAEVAVFLAPTRNPPETTDGTPYSPTLYGLFRRQFLTTPLAWSQPATDGPSPNYNYMEASTVPSAGENPGAAPLTFNSMQDLTQPVRRFWMDRSGTNAAQPAGVFQATPGGRYATDGDVKPQTTAADLLMPDVLSFDVRVLLRGDTDFRDLFDPAVQAFSTGGAGNNPAFNGAAGPRVFDTWSNQGTYATWNVPGTYTSVPLFQNAAGQPIIIEAIQITIRAWDFKTKKTRQVTLVQKM